LREFCGTEYSTVMRGAAFQVTGDLVLCHKKQLDGS
jgi:hypothetical protein